MQMASLALTTIFEISKAKNGVENFPAVYDNDNPYHLDIGSHP